MRGAAAGFVLAVILLSMASKNDTGFVSIVGHEYGAGAGSHTFGITLDLNQKTWRESEPGNRQEFFKTKSGKYIAPATSNTVYLCKIESLVECIKQADSQAGQLLPLNPDTAKKGDKGRGHAEETGKELEWEVQ
jgi:hypothetical protein